MEQTATGTLVKVATDGPEIDGIVFDAPSASKLVVAVVDRKRGPVLRTVDRTAVTEREEEGPNDRALQLLIKRTSPAMRGAARGGASGGNAGRSAGHSRGAAHRPTGR